MKTNKRREKGGKKEKKKERKKESVGTEVKNEKPCFFTNEN